MSKLRSRLKSALRNSLVLFAALTASGPLWAQMAQGNLPKPTVSDPFAGLHDALSSAADSLLAATAQRPTETSVNGTTSGQRPETTDLLNISRRADSRDKALQRVEQLRPLIEPILREEGIPTELAAVVLIESGGQPAALSSKGARGIWQFMPDTARRYGLTVGPGNDERLDVQKSTRAAARYLRDLYQRFGDWPLALAAYNAGVEAVNAAAAKVSHIDFANISYSLPLETRNYVPAVLGAMEQLSLGPRQARSPGHVLYAALSQDSQPK